MYKFTIGELGLSVEQTRNLTIYELNKHFQWFAQSQEEQWHKLRVLATYIVQPHTKKRLRPKDLIPLPSDVKARSFVRSEKAKEDVELKTKLFLKRYQRN